MKMFVFQVRLEEKLEMFDHTQVAMKKLSAQVRIVCFASSLLLMPMPMPMLKLYFAGGRSEGAAWS